MSNTIAETPVPDDQSTISDVMQGCPPSPENRVTIQNWDTARFNRWSFQNLSQILPMAPVSRGRGPIAELTEELHSLDDIPVIRTNGSETTVSGILTETQTDGFLVLHKGRIIDEQYFNRMTSETLHLAQSVSKSIVGTLVGIYIERGLIDPNTPVTDYVPELKSSGYSDAIILDVLNMRTGVKFNEDYTNPEAEFALLDMASGWKERKTGQEPDTIYDLLLSITKQRNHGEYFEYRSIDTDVLGWVCERVGGERLAKLISLEIWSRLGVEKDASFSVDKAGTALADAGFNATLRDFGRFGQMYLDMGYYNGQQIVSAEWVKSCRRGDTDAFKVLYEDYAFYYPNAAYSNQWWVMDNQREIYSARGVFGQMICIIPVSQLVVVKLSSWPTFLDMEKAVNTYRAVEAISKHLSQA